jgi:GTP cyclohydrolase II
VHSSCLTGDVFGSERCECGPQLSAAIDRMAEDPQGGLLVYMAGHEGRGIGLWAKAATYLLQDAGEDTYQANRTLGLPDDSRDFSDAASILKYFLGERPFRLLTNNPKKIEDLARHGLTRVERERHIVGVSRWNSRYLRAKRARGHRLNEDDIPL